MLKFRMTSRLLVPCVKLQLALRRSMLFPVGDIHETYRKEYHLLDRNFLHSLEDEKEKKLSNAAEPDEKLFWKLLQGQRSSSQMSAFLVEDKLITEKNLTCEMWANHFEAPGTPLGSGNSDSNFLAHVTASVEDILKSCTEDPSGVLCALLEYEERNCCRVCFSSKPGLSGVSTDYAVTHSLCWPHTLEPFTSIVPGFLSNTYSA